MNEVNRQYSVASADQTLGPSKRGSPEARLWMQRPRPGCRFSGEYTLLRWTVTWYGRLGCQPVAFVQRVGWIN